MTASTPRPAGSGPQAPEARPGQRPSAPPTRMPRSFAASLGVHAALAAVLLSVPFVWGSPDYAERGPLQVALVAPDAAPTPDLPEPPRELVEVSDPLEPVIEEVAHEAEPLDPSEVELVENFEELPLIDRLDGVAAQAFRQPRKAAETTEEEPLEKVENAQDPPTQPATPPVAAAPEVTPDTPPAPLAKHCRRPSYPRRAERRGWEGVVECLVTVGRDGWVSSVRLSRSSGYRTLDEAAVAAFETWRYRPGTRGGKPAEFTIRESFVFQLSSP